jgi:O-antigen/teichoic acid export membrane protein
MSSARKHLRNLAFNWGGHAGTLLVMFFLSPYIVGKLDAVSYGIWSLLSVLTGYMGIFDLGVRASVGRHVALYLGKDDPVGVDETIRAGFGVFTLTGGLILVVGILLGWFFPALFKGVSPEHYNTVRYLLPLMVVNVWLSAIAAIYSSVLAAHDRFDVARIVDMVVLVIRTVATIYALHVGWGLWGLAGTVIGGNILAVVGNRIYAGKYHQGLRSLPFLFSRKRLQELVGYGTYAFITSAAVKIIGQSDLVIVGAFLSVADVREYSVGAMLIYYSATFIKIISRTYFPAVQRAVARFEMGEVRNLFYRQMQISWFFGLLVWIGYFFYSHEFIQLWMLQPSFDQKSVAASSEIMSLLAVASIPLLFIIPCQNVLAASGKIRFTATLSIIEAIVNVVFSIVFGLVFNWGLLGVAAGTAVSRLLIPCVFLPSVICREIGIPIK